MPSDLGHGAAHAAPQPQEAGYSSNLDEMQLLLQDNDDDEEATSVFDDNRSTATTPPQLRPTLTLRLYASHFFSTWNSRIFEFGAVLFLASLYPHTLRPLSAYALGRSAAAVLGARAVGAAIDTRDRLAVVRVSIVGQRVAVAASCGAFWVMERRLRGSAGGGGGGGDWVVSALFALVVLLACVEKLCSVMNLIAVERDWVCR
jgi:solute carrier family 40 (iron-regulated transporter), member 1